MEDESENLVMAEIESESFEVKTSINVMEDIVKCLNVWQRGVKTFGGEDIQESVCRLCEDGEEDFKYFEPVTLVRKDRKYLLESLAAVVQEARGGKKNPWKNRCDFNLPRAAVTKERQTAMQVHGLLVEFEDI